MKKQMLYRKLLFTALIMIFSLSSYGQNVSTGLQYWDGVKWVIIPAGVPGQVLKLSPSRIPVWSYVIGSTGPAGGIIFYDKGDYSNGWRYLEASRSDQHANVGWTCNGIQLTTNCSAAIGAGRANTTAIVNACSGAVIAARICEDLVLNGFSDWFLPSKDELRKMHLMREEIGGFTNYAYWSSSTCSAADQGCNINEPWSQVFDNSGLQANWQINCPSVRVRAIRAF